MPWVQGHGAGGAEVDIAQAQYQVSGREQDVADFFTGWQAVDALHEVDVVGQPGGGVADRLAVFVHRLQGGAVFEGHGQVDDPAADFQFVCRRQGGFQVQQVLHQRRLGQDASIVPQLQGAHAGGEFQQAVGLHVGDGFHQGVDAQAAAEVHHVGAVFQQDVLVAGLSVSNFRAAVGFFQMGKDGGGKAVNRGQVRLHQIHHRRCHQALDGQFLALGEFHGGVVINGHEPDGVAGFYLADFPQFRLGNGHRAHKAAQAGAVFGQNHGHVTGEVDGADGVFAVVDIGRVQARFAAVGPGKLGLGAVQADAQAVGVVVHFPVLLEELLDGRFREEIGRTMGAIEHADFPVVRIVGDQVRVCRCGIVCRCCGGAGRQRSLADAEHIAGAQGPAAVAAELAEGEGGTAAEIHRYIEPAAYGEVGATALDGLTHRQNLAGFHGDGFPELHRFVIQGGFGERTGQGDDGILVELQAGADEGGFQAGGFVVVADDTVGDAEGIIVHGATGRHADVPVAHAAGVVLHGGVGAGFDHFRHGGFELEALQRPGGDNAIGKAWLGHHLAQVIQVGGNAHQPGFRQGGFQFGQGLVPVFAMDNQLGNHGVVVGGDFAAVFHPGIHPHIVFRPVHVGQLARRGLEVLQRILGVDTHFHGRAVQLRLEIRQVRAFAGGDLQHPLDQVQTGDRLGDRVLNLQAGIHFQEIELVPVGVVDVFHGTGGAVIHRLPKGDGRIQHFLAGVGRQVRGRGFFHHFLVPALQGAVPFAQGNHIACAIAEHLHFHMAGPGDEALQEHAAVVEETLALAAHGFKGIPEFAFAVAAGEADAATAGGAFQHHRVAKSVGGLQSFLEILQQTAARCQGHTGSFRQFPGPVLQAELAHLVGGGADKGNTIGLAGLGKVGVLGKKAIPRNNRLGAGVLGGRQNLGLVEVGFAGAVTGQGDRFIGQGHMQAMAILVGIDSNTANAHGLEGANGADRDFAPVGDQYFAKHDGGSPYALPDLRAAMYARQPPNSVTSRAPSKP